MPLVRITLKKTKNSKFKKLISKCIHESLLEVFNIPKDDLFQIIEEVKKSNIIFPLSYMGIEHTNNIIYILIIAKEGRSKKMKKLLFKSIANKISKKSKLSKKDIIISMIENNKDNWSFGNGKAQLS